MKTYIPQPNNVARLLFFCLSLCMGLARSAAQDVIDDQFSIINANGATNSSALIDLDKYSVGQISVIQLTERLMLVSQFSGYSSYGLNERYTFGGNSIQNSRYDGGPGNGSLTTIYNNIVLTGLKKDTFGIWTAQSISDDFGLAAKNVTLGKSPISFNVNYYIIPSNSWRIFMSSIVGYTKINMNIWTPFDEPAGTPYIVQDWSPDPSTVPSGVGYNQTLTSRQNWRKGERCTSGLAQGQERNVQAYEKTLYATRQAVGTGYTGGGGSGGGGGGGSGGGGNDNNNSLD